MRWYDIDLTSRNLFKDAVKDPQGADPPQDENAQVSRLLAAVQARVAQLPSLQNQHGLDSPVVVDFMIEVGQMLFQSVTKIQPDAFSPRRDHAGSENPLVGVAETDHVTGYHLCVPPSYLSLPWTWLHNGVGFLLERYAICAAPHRSLLRPEAAGSPWMQRMLALQLEQQIQGVQPLRTLLPRLRPREWAAPEILFVPGHGDTEVRRLIYREALGIKNALGAGALGRPLARLTLPDHTVTPAWLARQGGAYQGLHFAGPTAQQPEGSLAEAATWLSGLLADLNGDTARRLERDAETQGLLEQDLPLDLELELVGVDPITALLDTVAARAEAGRNPIDPSIRPANLTATLPRAPWWLEDGPFQPEDMARQGALPALIFSNSYRSLPELSARFLEAGAAVFLGPVAPLYSRPARKFAGWFYSFLGDGHCTATALRTAALACRSDLGANHPAWLSYGIVGHGSLALQYL